MVIILTIIIPKHFTNASSVNYGSFLVYILPYLDVNAILELITALFRIS